MPGNGNNTHDSSILNTPRIQEKLKGSATVEELQETSRQDIIRNLGIENPDASWEEIRNFKSDETETARKKYAEELGLSEELSWEELHQHNEKVLRAEKATELGIPEDSSWEDIKKAEDIKFGT